MTDMNNNILADDNPPIEVAVQDIMESSYLDYAMSVITGRALPDARDGLKPVHRRILHSMNSLSIGPSSAHKKSARVVGDVIGKYHPHGDSAVYEAAVRMSQPWVMQHPLIDGQGNFGSVDGDSAAAMRYTEMRMTRMGAQMFHDINKNTVNFRENYDGTEEEPEVLPVSYPNLWVNGSEGIAVGMATSVPPHNLGETIESYLAWVDNPEIELSEIAKIMPCPDFPSGGLVHGLDGYMSALETGRGRVKIRGRWHEEDRKGGAKRIVFTELPYLVNKAKLVEQIANLVQEKTIEGIVDLRDESNKKGIRVVLDVKKGYECELIAMQLISQTELEVSFNYNVRALVNQKPAQMGLLDIFKVFKQHRIEIIQRRTQFDLDKTMARLHILEGFLKALGMLDETIKTIRASKDAEEAREGLKNLLSIDDGQAKAILEMRLQKLTGLEIQDIKEEHKKLTDLADDLRDILASDVRQLDIMKTEILNVKDSHAISRRSEVASHLSAVTHEDLIKEEDVLIIATKNGYLKRVPVANMSRQNRGTKGRNIIDVGDDDFVTAVHTASTREYLMIVTDSGQVYAVKTHSIPETGIGSKGRHFRNVFEGMEADAHVVAILSVKDINSDDTFLVIATEKGFIKRTQLSRYTGSLRKSGVNGVVLEDGDKIVAARISNNENDRVIMVGSNSRAVCFEIGNVRPAGRNSRGVRGIRLEEDDIMLGYGVFDEASASTSYLVCIGEMGSGKKTLLSEFPAKGRGGKGMICFVPNRKSGPLAAATLIQQDSDMIIFNKDGGGNRVASDAIPTTGRSTSGSMLMRNGIVSDIISVPSQQEPVDDSENE